MQSEANKRAIRSILFESVFYMAFSDTKGRRGAISLLPGEGRIPSRFPTLAPWYSRLGIPCYWAGMGIPAPH